MLSPEEKTTKANELRTKGQFSQALKLYKESWKQEHSFKTGAGLLHCLRKLKKFEEGESLSKELLKKYPTLKWIKTEYVWLQIESKLRTTQSFNFALNLGEELVNIKSDLIIIKEIAFRLVKLANSKDEWDNTLQWLQKINPDDLRHEKIGKSQWSDLSRWRHKLSKAQMECGQYDEVLSEIDTDVEQFPELANFFLRIKANCFRLKGDLKKSEKAFLEMIKKYNDPWILVDYARLLTELDREEEALGIIYNVLYDTRTFKSFVKVLQETGDLCIKLGNQEEAFWHYNLSKIVREKEKWSIPPNLEKNISNLSGVLDVNIDKLSYKEIFKKCKTIWQQKRIQKEKTETKDKKTLKGKVSFVSGDRPYCFIKTKQGDIFCFKSLLPEGISENDVVICEVIPSYDKKKNRDSWKATKVMKGKD